MSAVSPVYSSLEMPAVPVVRLPESAVSCEQDHEWCELYEPDEGGWRRLRLHDYADIYGVPHLYEHLFANVLQCTSPQRVVGLLGEVLREWGQLSTQLNALDLGAGNGMVGEQLRAIGVRRLVGADIIPEAAQAAERDRPGMYDDYVVADFTSLKDRDVQRVKKLSPNLLTSVSALGFGDIPPKAFSTALNLTATPGWVAFNIKETFLTGHDETGFSRLIRALTESQILEVQAFRRYSHRLSVHGEKLKYVAMIARKTSAVPNEMVERAW